MAEPLIPPPALITQDDAGLDDDDTRDQTEEFPAEELPPEADELPARADLDEEDLDDASV